MNNTQDKRMECGPRQTFSLPQVVGRGPKSWRRRGLRRQAPLSFAVMPEHGRSGKQSIHFAAHARDAQPALSRAMVTAFSLALLLFSFVSAREGITNTQATAPDWRSASPSLAKPTRTPPGRQSPTPTTPASPTATTTASPAPSPTFTALPTTMPTLPASATPPVKATMPSTNQKQRGSQISTPISTRPTPSTTSIVQHTFQQQQKSELALFPVIIGTLSGIGGVTFLLAIGLLLLRKYLMPPAEVRLPPSGAAPWRRVRLDSLDDGDRMSISDENTQTLPVLGASAPTL